MLRARPRTASTVILLGAIVACLAAGPACDSGGVFERPILRVSLADKLPPKVRKLAEAGIDRYCRKRVDLADGPVATALVVAWRVLDFKGDRYVVAVEVQPDGDGKVDGVSGLGGSAWVGESRKRSAAGEPLVAAVPVRVGWSARKGCGKVGKSAAFELRADDPSCKAPKQRKLLRPVK